MEIIGAGFRESKGDGGAGGDIAEIERGIVGVGGVGSGADVGGDGAVITPSDGTSSGDSGRVGDEARSGDREGGLVEVGSDLVGGGSLTGWLVSIGKEEVVDDSVNECADNQVKSDPLPEWAFFCVVHKLI